MEFKSDPPRPADRHRIARRSRTCERMSVESSACHFPNMNRAVQDGQSVKAPVGEVGWYLRALSGLEQFLKGLLTEGLDHPKSYVTRAATYVKPRATSVKERCETFRTTLLWQSGARHFDLCSFDSAAARRATFLRIGIRRRRDKQRPPVGTAEHARECVRRNLDPLDNLAALLDANDFRRRRTRHPDRILRIQANSIG